MLGTPSSEACFMDMLHSTVLRLYLNLFPCSYDGPHGLSVAATKVRTRSSNTRLLSTSPLTVKVPRFMVGHTPWMRKLSNRGSSYVLEDML
jgi:hypothetical protein